MLKKRIAYTDYNGVNREEDFYFNLTKAELAEMEMSTDGGMEQKIQRIISEQNTPKIVEIFKGIILQSYGEKSDDGRRFMKSPERSKAFSETEAYSILFMELSTNAEAASAFIRGIIPAEAAKELEKQPIEMPVQLQSN